MTTLRFVLLFMLGGLVSAGYAATPATSSAEYLVAVEASSPATARALKTLGRDYHQKCGKEPTVSQYQAMVQDAPAYRFLVSMTGAEAWTSAEKSEYAGLIASLPCAQFE